MTLFLHVCRRAPWVLKGTVFVLTETVECKRGSRDRAVLPRRRWPVQRTDQACKVRLTCQCSLARHTPAPAARTPMRFGGESVGRGLADLWLASWPCVLRTLSRCARTSACASGLAARDQPSPPPEDQAREIEL